MKLNASMLVIALMFIISVSCDDQEKELKKEDKFVSVKIPNDYLNGSLNGRSSSDNEVVIRNITVTTVEGNVVYGKVKLTLPTDGEGLLAFEMTQNIFDETELTPTFWTDGTTPGAKVNGIGECLSGCQDIPKGEGRGWCKAGCWLELAATVAIVIIAVA